MIGSVSSKRNLKSVKLFIAQMGRRINSQWIRTIKVALEPTSHPSWFVKISYPNYLRFQYLLGFLSLR